MIGRHIYTLQRRHWLPLTLHETFEFFEDLFGGVDMVVMAQARADVNDSEKLQASLRKHLQKVATCAPR